ncbi:MAG: long-chain fatty acid--CoA ligase [Nocardioidaceae bacterium]|nr:long-chain fatty acid--CoA ligase [Nocardioidaceae bacterium]
MSTAEPQLCSTVMLMVTTRNAEAIIANRPGTVGRMFFDRVEVSRDRDAYTYPEGETWESVTWGEVADHVVKLSAGLIALGVRPEQRVAIDSGTRYEWVLADLAIMSAGAATTTVYPSSRPEDVAFIIADSDSHVAFAADDEQVAKLRERRADLPALSKVVTFDGTTDGDWVINLQDLEALGTALLAEQPNVVRDRVDSTGPASLATVMYTSGTTGRPKGVRLRHSSWTYEGAAVDALDILSIDDVQFLWLPLAHSFGKVLLTAQLAIGFSTAIDGRVEKIVENMAVVRPTFMGAAPRIFEKAHARIHRMTAEAGGVKKKIFDRAFAVGKEVSRRRLAGEKVPPHLAAQYRIFDRLVFAKIRDRFGGRVRFFVSGAAALNREIAEWFHAADILILEGYGLTETSAGSCLNLPSHYKFGTVGPPLPGTEVKLADDGEVLIKGPGVMDAYHNQAVATDDVVDDGWLHTGDIGEVDADGFLRITDRKKDLFKTSGGKYVAPQSIEAQFKAVCPYVGQIVVHGNERNFCSAIVTLDPESIDVWAARNGLAGSSYSEIAGSDQAREMVQGYVDQLNARLNRWETIKRFIILDHDLSVEEGEITPSMKVKRRVVEDRYRDELDTLYR